MPEKIKKKIERIDRSKLVMFGFASSLVVLGILMGLIFEVKDKEYKLKAATIYPTATTSKTISNHFFYKGETGKNALEILKQKASIEQDNSGMVSSVNGRKADLVKHEYWAFYVNGSLAQAGAADYQTKDSDKIEWRIEKY